MRQTLLTMLALAIVVSGANAADVPAQVKPKPTLSFPNKRCELANTYVERTVCSDRVLFEADQKLGGLHIAARIKAANLGGRRLSRLFRADAAWLRTRDACRDVPCIRGAYIERLAALQSYTAY